MDYENEYNSIKEYKYICDELKNRRLALKKSQEDVAFDLGFTAGHLSRIENGKKLSTSLKTFLILSNYYDLDFGTLVKKANAKMKIDECNFDE
ncbi:helix-turn-helix domain-containing protein [Staphylococcus xylosus]|uniref:helix-turn-helix domain-containing protein n=1 Tax=Staphylococcus xylosus TaxID=1288 RepID=UPI0011CBBD02|nr:helix-turn-helix transcriptional regulator [Staphylococcus xylosus]